MKEEQELLYKFTPNPGTIWWMAVAMCDGDGNRDGNGGRDGDGDGDGNGDGDGGGC